MRGNPKIKPFGRWQKALAFNKMNKLHENAKELQGRQESTNKRSMKKLGFPVILLCYYFESFLDRLYQPFYLIQTIQFTAFKRLTPSLPIQIT